MILAKTVLRYKNFYENDSAGTMNDLNYYVMDAKKKNLEWSAL